MQIGDNARVLLHLSLVRNLGPGASARFLKHYQQVSSVPLRYSISAMGSELLFLYDLTVHDFVRRFGLTLSAATRVHDGLADHSQVQQEVELLAKNPSIQMLTILDNDYPAALRTIHLPPTILYYQGTLPAPLEESIAVVGSREGGSYAQQVVSLLVPPLVRAGLSIVSGGARGVDGMAHNATLEALGKTVVVLGSGLLDLYPAQHIPLFKKIIASGGTLLSCFPLRAAPLPGNFPARNRIIAGLSRGCLLIAAAAKSGSHITAQFALTQGKCVFAVPGSIFDPLSQGTHALLAQGARLVSSAHDIFDEFGDGSEPVEEQLSMLSVSRQAAAQPAQKAPAHPLLVHLSSPCSIDELCLKSGQDMVTLYDTLFELQLSGLVNQNFAGLWELS